jgi:hypothetical protein
MVDDREVEQRIREAAYRMWEAEGRPEGRATAHWDLARVLIGLEDSKPSMMHPVEPERPEPIEAVENQGEFPTLTDQGEQNLPGRRRNRKAAS